MTTAGEVEVDGAAKTDPRSPVCWQGHTVISALSYATQQLATTNHERQIEWKGGGEYFY